MVPETEDQLAEAIREASGPLRIEGGGTRGIASEGELLSVRNLSGIELYEPGALTLVAKSGTTLSEVEAALARDGQRLAFEPMDHRELLGTEGEATIGGVVAANVSGPRRVAMGACRDFMLGVRFVDGTGTVMKNGGRVMKNVTGYDLVKLLTGSFGTLGVLTEVSLKVLPRPETQATIAVPQSDMREAVAAMAKALGSPFEVTGAAWTGAQTLVRIEGFGDSVDYRGGRLRDLLAPFGTPEMIRVEDSVALWTGVRNVTDFAELEGAVWRLSLRPSEAPDVLARLPGAAKVRLDWGGGLAWVLVPEGTDVRAALGAFDGHATRVRGSGGGPRFQPEVPAVAALSAGLRTKFDPRGILNPGVLG